jgi:hypothetical protein
MFGVQGLSWTSKNPFSKEKLEAVPKKACLRSKLFFSKKSLSKKNRKLYITHPL